MLPGLSSQELKDLLMSVGTHQKKRRLSPMEVSKILHKTISSGAGLEECRNFVQLKDRSVLKNFLTLSKLSPGLQHLVDWGQSDATISFTASTEISRLNEDEQQVLGENALKHRLRKNEVKQIVQLRRRSRRKIEDCIDEIVGMRPQIETRYMFVGIVRKGLRRKLLEMKQLERDLLFSRVVFHAYPEIEKKSFRLGEEMFTIVTDEDGANQLKAGGDECFEESINRSLEEMDWSNESISD